MTRGQAEALPRGARVLIDAGTEHEELARLWVPDAKWTRDMRGAAVVQRIREDGTVPSWAVNRGFMLASRRRLTVAPAKGRR